MSRPSAPRFADAYRDNVDAVHRFLAYRVQSRELAEDLTGQTFEKALRAWPRYDAQQASVLTWLFAIARNTLIDHLRADRGELALDAGHAESLAAHDAPRLGASEEVVRALQRLNDREREIVGLRFAADLSGPEIAAVTGLSVANVQQILSRTLRRLRDELDQA